MANLVRLRRRGRFFYGEWDKPRPRGAPRRIRHLSLRTPEERVAQTRQAEVQKELDYNRDPNLLWWVSGGEPEQRNEKQLEAAIREYQARYFSELRPKSRARYSLALRRFGGYCAERGIGTLSEISAVVVEDFKLERLNTASPATVALELRVLSSLCTACKRRGWIQANPCEGVKKPKGRSRPPRTYTEEEIQKLFQKAAETDPVLWAKMQVLLHTGVRKDEFVYQRAEQVDLRQRRVVIQDRSDWSAKTDRSQRRIPLNPDAVQAYRILLRGKGKDDLVAPSARGNVDRHLYRQIRRLGERAGVKAELHAFRHTFADTLRRKGTDIVTISLLLGHSKVLTTIERYLHPGERDMVEAVARLEGVAATGVQIGAHFSRDLGIDGVARAGPGKA